MQTTSILANARKALMSASVVLLLTAPSAAFAVSTGLEATRGEANLPKTTLDASIGKVIAQVIGLVGVVFLALMVYGGFLYMTARGDEKQVGTAKGVIVSAIIGVALVFGAYAITEAVFNAVAPGSGQSDQQQCEDGGGTWIESSGTNGGSCA
jgi:hypothetical protein